MGKHGDSTVRWVVGSNNKGPGEKDPPIGVNDTEAESLVLLGCVFVYQPNSKALVTLLEMTEESKK